MLLAIISDTHLSQDVWELPEACVDRLEEADEILHAGDFVSAGIYTDLRAIGPPVHAVHGNVDDLQLQHLLPTARLVKVGGAKIALIHDAGPAPGRLERLRKRFPRCGAVVFGHSHIPQHERDEASGFQIFNPGSPTDRRRSPRHTMGQARVEDGEVTFELVDLGP
ncbi:MAG TPA: metallophosphoesterase family protein [Solirubrobacteraceae bacterium]